MTRDEHRAKCLHEMEVAYLLNSGKGTTTGITAAFDALATVPVTVCPLEATEEMIEAGATRMYGKNWNGPADKMPGEKMKDVWRRYAHSSYASMSAAGNLTDGPEK